ncbi:MAG: CBS domain-containing protein [Anaerolineales bacterium]|nr:CBS domain-containing protein [Anaerolineales bacterium]
MRLILTHEQADFDALASLFGASLLDERSIPVLPRRLNRNVRSFITLYGSDFSFVDPRDLPQGKVESVTLVDTQSLVTLKGMGEKTTVRVIDHHPLRSGLPPDWQLTIDEIGATTTMLIEAMQVQNGHISSLQATLLLLGIYEDTGSLTYSRTTPRDVRAAAWLLEHGANLKIAADFLNPPLSADQRKLYEVLLDNAQTHHISGHRVVIACGDARDVDEEISTLAHKLRDLLDPDALFVVVSTQDGIRIVARSTSDAIDVSNITAEFGGGGHDRAAAALIRTPLSPAGRGAGGEGQMPRTEKSQDNGSSSTALKEACEKLLEALPNHVQPSITVAEIMSRDPHLLNLETPVKEVSQLMQRTGFEGYPVVDGGKVVGLLTRRAVDRALAHKLNLTASSLMEAGAVTVSPEDSLQSLQVRMTDSGWGQVPVVNEEGKVLGIVTRTDLLKTLAPPAARTGARNMVARLEAALPPAHLELIRCVAAQASEQRMAVYIVGGFVRDLLLERPGLDFDIVIEGDAIALGKALGKRYGGRVTSHTRFGTAKWYVRESKFGKKSFSTSQQPPLPEFLDLISARTEFYEHPTALPTVERGSIKLDLHRRDFTINTLALRLDGHHYGELHDYWGGLADLERGYVRVLHSLSFVDDPTRMLRAVRYEQRYGFEIESRTRQLMEEAQPLLEKLSPERVRHELDLILDEPNWFEMLARLADLGLLTAIHPELPLPASDFSLPTDGELASYPPSGLLPPKRTLAWLLWLSAVKPATIKTLSRRLRFPAALTKLSLAASSLRDDLSSLKDAKPSGWVDCLEDVPEFAIYALSLSSEGKTKRALLDYLETWRHIKPKTTGHDLKELGLSPGPKYKNILRQLRAAWLDGKIKSEKEEIDLLLGFLLPPANLNESDS